jgi:hypothetical protein
MAAGNRASSDRFAFTGRPISMSSGTMASFAYRYSFCEC